ncbi:M1 family metallopeptidase [candidate division KSB1 bacterium]
MKRVIASFLFVSLFNTVSSADNYPRNNSIDIIHYLFMLELTDNQNVVQGETSIDIRFLTDGVTEFSLDLIGKVPGEETGMTVTNVRNGDVSLDFSHENNRIRIRLRQPSNKNERRTITVIYSGIPADGLIIDENKFGERTFFGDNWPDRARHWLPSIDHPYDKATCEFMITAPERYQVIANGAKTEESSLPEGMRLTHWTESVTIPTYCMVIGVARFAVQYVDEYNGIPIQTWVYPQNKDEGFYDFARARRVIAFYSSQIGPYPYEKLANVQSKTRYGGMENASNIFYSERSVSGQRRSEGTVTHEIAHMWFGDSVTQDDWHHVWLSEGFATYFTHLFNEFTYGRDRLVEGMKANRDRVLRYYERNPTSPLVDTSITELTRLLSANSYQKGGWVLHMLRYLIGDENFWEGIRIYYREFRNDNAMTADLQRVMEEVSGRDLEGFFQQWIFQPGQPSLMGTWDFRNGELSVMLDQVQTDGTFFRFPLELGIYREGQALPEIQTVQIDNRENRFTIALDSPPGDVVLDPNTWVLMMAEFERR